jgi:hypothetical protein
VSNGVVVGSISREEADTHFGAVLAAVVTRNFPRSSAQTQMLLQHTIT